MEVANLRPLMKDNPTSFTSFYALVKAVKALNDVVYLHSSTNGQSQPVELSDERLIQLVPKIRAVHQRLAYALLHAPKTIADTRTYVNAILKLFETAITANQNLGIFLTHATDPEVVDRLPPNALLYTSDVSAFLLSSTTWPTTALELYEYIGTLLAIRFLGMQSSSTEEAARKASIRSTLTQIVPEPGSKMSPEERQYRETRSILSVFTVALEMAQKEQTSWSAWWNSTAGQRAVEIQRNTLTALFEVIKEQIDRMADANPVKVEALRWHAAASKTSSGTAPEGAAAGAAAAATEEEDDYEDGYARMAADIMRWLGFAPRT